jgi:hypothetical protein
MSKQLDPFFQSLLTAPANEPIIIAETGATLVRGDIHTLIPDASTVLLKPFESAPLGHVLGVAIDADGLTKGAQVYVPVLTEWTTLNL